MKNFILFLICSMLFMLSAILTASAQRQLTNPSGNTLSLPDTLSDGATMYLWSPRQTSGNKMIIQLTSKRVSGTTNFHVTHEVSIDNSGTAAMLWYAVAADTFSTSGNGDYTIIFKSDQRYAWQRVKIVQTGTQKNAIKAWYQME